MRCASRPHWKLEPWHPSPGLFCACEDEDTREAAHQAAGTLVVMIDLALADLEAGGEICRTGELRNGKPVFARKHS
jgi:hypothetical protein